MRDQSQDKKKGGRAADPSGSQKKNSGDAGGEMLAQLAKCVGNEALQKQISGGQNSRNEMFAFLTDRLRNVRALQLREISLTQKKAYYPWWKQVADAHKTQFTKPEPTRWKLTAELYERAAKQLAQGDLARARHLLLDAAEEEQRTRDSMTALVNQTEVEVDAEPDAGAIQALADLPQTGPCEMPSEVRIAQDIKNVTANAPDPMNRKRAKDPWWTWEEEEEEGSNETN
jgi:hypothetical protein